jgi:hypothetical protein
VSPKYFHEMTHIGRSVYTAVSANCARQLYRLFESDYYLHSLENKDFCKASPELLLLDASNMTIVFSFICLFQL